INSGTLAGTYPFTVTATSGSLVHTANAALTITPPPDFSVVATPANRSVAAGSNDTFTVTTSALNGFAGAVGFSLSGLPAGVSGAFSPTTVIGSGSSTLTLTASNSAITGSYPLTITATSGTLSHTANVSLVITDFGLAATPSARSVAAGSIVTSSINV